MTNVVTDIAIVGGTGRFFGATGAGKLRVTQFNPAGTTNLLLAVTFFSLANPVALPPAP